MIKINHEKAKRFHMCKIIFVFLEQKLFKDMKNGVENERVDTHCNPLIQPRRG